MQITSEHQLYNTLSRMSRQIHRMEHWIAGGVLGKAKLYRGQAHLLLLISQNNGASQGDLAEITDVRPSSMTEMLVKMEQTGLVTRRQDDKDQRIMRIFLTEDGRRIANEAKATVDDFTTKIFNCLTAEEQDNMLKLIEKVSANIEDLYSSDVVASDHHGACHKYRHQGAEAHCRHHLSFDR